MNLSIRRSSSPFDHHASFVPFPSIYEGPPTVVATATAAVTTTTTNKHIDQPIPTERIDKPRKTPIPIPTPTAPSNRGIQHLAKSMGYRMHVIDDREARLVFADALTCIEKLTVGHAVTRRPRAMTTRLILDALMKILSRERLVLAAGERDGGWCDGDTIAGVAAEYILDLKKNVEGGGVAEEKRDGCAKIGRRACVKELSGNGPIAVGKALEKIEGWCDGWLERKISDVDWVRMEDCLEIP